MLSAEEGRQELKKDVLDRLEGEQKEELKVFTEIFTVDLEETISSLIKQTLVAEESSFSLRMVAGREHEFNNKFWSNWDILDGYKIYAPRLLREAYITKIIQVVEKQVEELKDLGYNAQAKFSEAEAIFGLRNMRIELMVDWKEETKDAEKDFFQRKYRLREDAADVARKEVKEKLYILNSEDKNISERWFK